MWPRKPFDGLQRLPLSCLGLHVHFNRESAALCTVCRGVSCLVDRSSRKGSFSIEAFPLFIFPGAQWWRIHSNSCGKAAFRVEGRSAAAAES